MTTFSTVLVSASTSAGVALAIEWFAKPGLEARKERILERYGAQRKIIRQLMIIVSIAGSLSAELPDTLSEADRRKVMQWLQERRQAAVDAGRQLDEVSFDALLKMNPTKRAIVARTAGLSQAIVRTESLRHESSEQLYLVAGTALDLCLLPRWRFRAKKRLLQQARILTSSSAS